MKLLYITYKVDEQDSLVGFAVGWINALAARLEHVHVVCLARGPAQLAANVSVHSLGKERGVGRLGRLVNFYRAAWAIRRQVQAVFCQFSPIYVILIAPLAKLLGWPIVLWYTHRHVGLELRLATALADRVVTASPESFRLRTPKVRVIGHGIDTDRFCPGESASLSDERKVILAVGRLAPIKNYEMLIEAARILIHEHGREEVKFLVVGGVEGRAPAGYADSLKRRVAEAGLNGYFEFVGPVPHDRIVDYYRRAAVAVNLCPTGGLDKAVLEGMAVGVPTVVMNEAFRSILAEWAQTLLALENNGRAIADRLDQAATLPEPKRRQLSAWLRQQVLAGFSQPLLGGNLAKVLAELVE